MRAQSLISDDARAALVRAEAAYTDASQRLGTVRREASEVQQRVHQWQVELLRLSQQAEPVAVMAAMHQHLELVAALAPDQPLIADHALEALADLT